MNKLDVVLMSVHKLQLNRQTISHDFALQWRKEQRYKSGNDSIMVQQQSKTRRHNPIYSRFIIYSLLHWVATLSCCRGWHGFCNLGIVITY